MVCIRCQKRPAIIFIQRMDNGQMKQEGYCLHCARELHIKPVDDLMKQFGMSDQDLDNMENRMESMMEEMGDANPLSMMMNMANGGEDADPDSMDEDLIPGSNATFPLGFTSSEKKDGDKKADRKNGKKPPKRKFLDTYCENLTRKAREMLDEAGWTECKISVSNSLDEYLIQDMLLQGAQIDLFGVGERMITAKSEPVFGGVYKLVAIEEPDGTVIPKIKVSENVEKITIPHFKKVYRLFGRDTGKAIADYITVYDETVDDTKGLTIFDPMATWKRKDVYNFEARELLVPIFKNGKRVYDCPPLEEIKAYCAQQVDTLWDEVKRFDYPHKYYVDLSDKLWDIQQCLLRTSQL